MALKADILGMVWRYPDTFVVGREQVRQYSRSVKANDPASFHEAAAAELGHSAIVASPTFMSIFAVMIQTHFFQNVDVGLETMQIVQVDQKFLFHRPIKAGDEVTGTMTILTVDERFGADIVTTHNVLATPEATSLTTTRAFWIMAAPTDSARRLISSGW